MAAKLTSVQQAVNHAVQQKREFTKFIKENSNLSCFTGNHHAIVMDENARDIQFSLSSKGKVAHEFAIRQR